MSGSPPDHEARRLLGRYAAAKNQREQHDYLYAMPAVLEGLLEQLEAMRDVLVRLRQWDVLNLDPGSGDDGPYWREQIDRVLSNPASRQDS